MQISTVKGDMSVSFIGKIYERYNVYFSYLEEEHSILIGHKQDSEYFFIIGGNPNLHFYEKSLFNKIINKRIQFQS